MGKILLGMHFMVMDSWKPSPTHQTGQVPSPLGWKATSFWEQQQPLVEVHQGRLKGLITPHHS